MHSVDGPGGSGCTQVGRYCPARDDLQNFSQDWPNQADSSRTIFQWRGTCIASRRVKGEAMIDTVRRSSMVKHSRLPKLSSRACEKEFASLLELSARLGCEPRVVQANNGKTSAQRDAVL